MDDGHALAEAHGEAMTGFLAELDLHGHGACLLRRGRSAGQA
jgi:hypothetical protein